MGQTEQLNQLNEQDQQAAQDFINEMAVDVMARTLWGEARSETTLGMQAVAQVILNRVAKATANGGAYWWGHDVITVCQKPYQFSCWNPADPNRPKLMAVDARDIHFATCLRIARRAVMGQLGVDITMGADHYHTKNIMPFWARGQRPVATIGHHVFYQLEGA